MTLDCFKYLNFQRDLKRVLKKHKKASADLKLWARELAAGQLPFLGDLMQGRPEGFPELWKFRIALKSENIGQRAGLRLIGIRIENTMAAVCLYTKADLDGQPPWADLKKWFSEQA